MVGHRWVLFAWFLSKFSAELQAADNKGRLGLELTWLAKIRTVPEQHLLRLIEEAQDEHDELLAEIHSTQEKIKERLAVVRVKRNKRIVQNHRLGIPQLNPLTAVISNALVQDIDVDIHTICRVVDGHPADSLTALIEMQMNITAQMRVMSPGGQAKIRYYIKMKHRCYLMRREHDVLKWNDTLLNHELALWNDVDAGLRTPCGRLHFDDSSESSSTSTEKSSESIHFNYSSDTSSTSTDESSESSEENRSEGESYNTLAPMPHCATAISISKSRGTVSPNTRTVTTIAPSQCVSTLAVETMGIEQAVGVGHTVPVEIIERIVRELGGGMPSDDAALAVLSRTLWGEHKNRNLMDFALRLPPRSYARIVDSTHALIEELDKSNILAYVRQTTKLNVNLDRSPRPGHLQRPIADQRMVDLLLHCAQCTPIFPNLVYLALSADSTSSTRIFHLLSPTIECMALHLTSAMQFPEESNCLKSSLMKMTNMRRVTYSSCSFNRFFFDALVKWQHLTSLTFVTYPWRLPEGGGWRGLSNLLPSSCVEVKLVEMGSTAAWYLATDPLFVRNRVRFDRIRALTIGISTVEKLCEILECVDAPLLEDLVVLACLWPDTPEGYSANSLVTLSERIARHLHIRQLALGIDFEIKAIDTCAPVPSDAFLCPLLGCSTLVQFSLGIKTAYSRCQFQLTSSTLSTLLQGWRGMTHFSCSELCRDARSSRAWKIPLRLLENFPRYAPNLTHLDLPLDLFEVCNWTPTRTFTPTGNHQLHLCADIGNSGGLSAGPAAEEDVSSGVTDAVFLLRDRLQALWPGSGALIELRGNTMGEPRLTPVAEAFEELRAIGK
ncbi:hypothetical protein CALCODRAFT_513343 [Calocera cornea HHB12733]|uniref:F-box domain-containing protein n=1 Tax=Calocera cornea HHB12733 TaxID=1353952 RepID=A0A165C7B3_9BASI|nr:hypothetical protein CALCODRAFT_513343 [Calocera cornea HHB12733]